MLLESQYISNCDLSIPIQSISDKSILQKPYYPVNHFFKFSLQQKGRTQRMNFRQKLFCYLMGLDGLDVAGEVKVEVKLVNILVFVLLGTSFFVALN